MDSDEELIDDEVFNSSPSLFDHYPFPSDCQNEIEGIESFSKCFRNRYNDCPAFFMGSLQDACQSALNSDDRRPVLVYIHHDKSPFSNIFCWNAFCSGRIIEYLLEHYIVWPWDITFESNQKILRDIWSKLSTEFTVEFTDKQCPMLIGIMRHSIGAQGFISSFDYECKLLLRCDTMKDFESELSQEGLLDKLKHFKEQFDINEQNLTFDFLQKTRLPPEIFLETIQYLHANDIINAFSSNIIPFLIKYNVRLHLSDPTHDFLNAICRQIKPKQIVSLCRKADSDTRTLTFSSSDILSNIISLTLINFTHGDQQIIKCATYYPNLRNLSLQYNNEVTYHTIVDIIHQFRNPIRRVEVHSAKIRRHRSMALFESSFNQNPTVEYLLLHVDFTKRIVGKPFVRDDDNQWFLRQTVEFIQCMINLRSVRLLVNSYNLERFLNGYEWKNLVYRCLQLRKITLGVIGNVLNDQQWELVLKIQKDLQEVRDTIKFQVINN